MDENGQVETEIAQYREAIQEDPEDQISPYLLPAALEKKGDLDGAITEYREAVRLSPADWSAHFGLALALDEKGDLNGAITEYRELLRLDRADANLKSLLAEVLWHGKGFHVLRRQSDGSWKFAVLILNQ